MFSGEQLTGKQFTEIFECCQAFAILHVKSNHRGAKISCKKLTMENQKSSKKRGFLEEKDGVHHGREKENQD